MSTAPASNGAAQPSDAGHGRQLDRAAFAEMAGYSAAGTVTSLLARGRERRRALQETVAAGGTVSAEHWHALFPEPDGQLGRTPYWFESTVRRWMRVRLRQGMSPAPEGAGAEAEAGPGDCPICGKHCPGSVASHRQRRDMCSYDPRIREAASSDGERWAQEKADQAGPGTCPVCHEHFEKSVTAHRVGKRECSFDPDIRAAARGD